MRVQVGRVGKPHGLEGAFVVEEASDDPERFAARRHAARRRRAGEGGRVEARRRAAGDPGRPRRSDAARRSRSSAADLPQPEEGEYYAFQLVGLEVEEAGGQKLGRVTEVSTGPANDVLELDTGLALPLVDACVREVDLERGRILVEPGFAADS